MVSWLLNSDRLHLVGVWGKARANRRLSNKRRKITKTNEANLPQSTLQHNLIIKYQRSNITIHIILFQMVPLSYCQRGTQRRFVSSISWPCFHALLFCQRYGLIGVSSASAWASLPLLGHHLALTLFFTIILSRVLRQPSAAWSNQQQQPFDVEKWNRR
jgi:hypothetical protein